MELTLNTDEIVITGIQSHRFSTYDQNADVSDLMVFVKLKHFNASVSLPKHEVKEIVELIKAKTLSNLNNILA